MAKKRTLGGLSSKLLEQIGEENEPLEDEGKEEIALETREDPRPASKDQDEDLQDEDLVEFVKNPRKEKQKKEDTHERKTFLIEKELIHWMKSESKKYGHGFYVDFVNASLRLGKQKYEEAKKAKKSK
jgi:hypothetical protein